MAVQADYEAFIFRKFDRLSARNLLHLEAKLAYLEAKLDIEDKKAAQSQENETLRSIRTWEAFEEQFNAGDVDCYRQMALLEEIKETLKEYHETLLRQNQIAMLEKPKKRALDVARDEFFERIFGGDRQPMLAGFAEKRLDECNHQELVAVRRQADKDPLSLFLQDHWMFKTTSVTEHTECIKESHVVWVAATISVIVAALLLLGAIVMLLLLDDRNTQLGIIAMFTALFAVSVGVLTNARRAEIFASTAAYTAVLVVFVSSPASSSSPFGCTCSLPT
ncbi:uncharacterized protein F4822DRAFT_427350 [Hypoxylon trugodes]|uniref:uncharacterized protein n=1 Tax=Hypoxylon trugodes TaxID=326681 RepID=UPI00219F0F7A|nr:uncharacterized protein F4822DRAFT_427350 [Hypoxylon trugodes]KAI1391503.1 hypothetical protein F4822DRAFT_427350 [Hypoxylon trugodes]